MPKEEEELAVYYECVFPIILTLCSDDNVLHSGRHSVHAETPILSTQPALRSQTEFILQLGIFAVTVNRHWVPRSSYQSSNTDSNPDGQECVRPKVYIRTHKGPTEEPYILSNLKPINTPISYLKSILILSTHLSRMFPKWVLIFRFLVYNCTWCMQFHSSLHALPI